MTTGQALEAVWVMAKQTASTKDELAAINIVEDLIVNHFGEDTDLTDMDIRSI